jgi:hypothetical protein
LKVIARSPNRRPPSAAGFRERLKAREIDDLRSVVHVALEHEIVPVHARRPVLHVAFVGVQVYLLGSLGQGAPEVLLPVAQPRLQHDVRRREDDVFDAAGDWRREYPGIPQLAPPAVVSGWGDGAANGAGDYVPEATKPFSAPSWT